MSKVAVEKHFVRLFSPGTFMSEVTDRPMETWNVEAAIDLAAKVNERYGARPYAFRFITRGRGADDFDSRETASSPLYFLGGTIRTLEEVERDNKPDEEILRSNMRCNGYKKVITNDNSWRATLPFGNEDVLLDVKLPSAAVTTEGGR